MMKVWSAVPVLAKRFLLSKSSDGFLSFIAWVSVVGVSLGVLALTVVTSVINGFEGELSRVITGMNGDVVVFTHSEAVSNPGEIETRIRSVAPETQAIAHSLISELMVSGPSGVAGSVLEGVSWPGALEVTELQNRVTEGRLPKAQGDVAL
jgi:lipoprotein-releasing system permease protein